MTRAELIATVAWTLGTLWFMVLLSSAAEYAGWIK